MTKSARAVVLSVVAALGVAWFWLGSNEVTISSPPETHASTPNVPATETPVVAPSAAAVEDETRAPAASSVATPDERSLSEAKKISDAFKRGVTSTFVAYLTSKGASREDSERIVGDAMREIASCVLEAVRAEGPQAPLAVTVGNPPMKLSGVFFSESVRGCMTSVQERIGLPPTVTYGMNAQGGTVEFTAQVLPP